MNQVADFTGETCQAQGSSNNLTGDAVRVPHELSRRAEEYRQVLEAQGRDPEHVRTVFRHCSYILSEVGQGGLTRSGVELALGKLIKAGRSLRTVQHNLTSWRAFARWCCDEDNRYLERDPSRSIKTFKVSKDPRHTRRAMSEDELCRLLEAANQCPLTWYGLTGADWAERWHVFVATGLREKAIGQLTVAQFSLTTPEPGLIVRGYQEMKRGKDRFVPLNPDSAHRILLYLEGKPASALAFPLPNRYAVLNVFRKHLTTAKIPHMDEQPGPGGIVRRENVVDVHSLRTTAGTRMARAGVPIKFAQEFLGHSTPVLTQNVYSRVTHSEISRAILALPRLNPVSSPITPEPPQLLR